MLVLEEVGGDPLVSEKKEAGGESPVLKATEMSLVLKVGGRPPVLEVEVGERPPVLEVEEEVTSR